jgi:hypothetical protein
MVAVTVKIDLDMPVLSDLRWHSNFLTFASGRVTRPEAFLGTGAVSPADQHVTLRALVADCGAHTEVGTRDGSVD